MKFLLIGCNGKMGKAIINLADEYNDQIVCGIDTTKQLNSFPTYINSKNIEENFDAIIDFSTTFEHSEFIHLATTKNVPYALFSTTANNSTLTNLKVASKTIPVLHCSNTSLGVNLLFELIEKCSSTLKKCEVIIQEYHHKFKLDKPSGTAKQIEKILTNNNIPFSTHSFRVGQEKGKHIVEFHLLDETLTLSHVAHSRNTFARGAILAMHKLTQKPAGYYTTP